MVKIESIYIENYRGIKKGRIDDLGNLNILVGKNGSGKSTALEPLIISSAIFSAVFPYNVYQGEKIQFLSAKRNLQGTIHTTPDLKITFNSEHWFYGGNHNENINFNIATNINSLNAVFFFKKEHNYQISPSDNLGLLRNFFANIMYLDASLVTRQSVEENTWDNILIKALKDKIIEHFNTIYPLKIKSIDYSRNGFYVTPENAKYGVLLDNLGSGMRIGMRLLILLMLLSNTAVIIEEFDAFQHPESLDALIKIIFHISKENELQFFFTTHRKESIKGFLANYAKYPECDGRIIGTILKPNGELITKSIKFSDAQNLSSAGFDFRDIEDYV